MRLKTLAATIALATAALGAQAAALALTSMQTPTRTASNLLVNAGFDSSNVAVGSYNYIDYSATAVVSASGWSFSGYSGVANQSSAWGGVAASNSVAFLQSLSLSPLPTLTQTFSSSATALSIDFRFANRPGYGIESLRVLIDDIDLTPTLLVAGGTSWNGVSLGASGLTGGSHTLRFVGVNSTGSSDAALFLDNIVVQAVDVPEPGTLALVGAAIAAAGLLRRRPRAR